MTTWAGIILAALRLVQWLIEQGERHKWLNEGEQRQIARATAETLKKQEFANETLKHVSGLSDAGVDELLRTLEGPPEAGGSQR